MVNILEHSSQSPESLPPRQSMSLDFWTSHHRAETARLLPLIYARCLAHFGPLNWWPGETREEVILGAVLTQNTAWSNVERAIEALRREDALTLRAVAAMNPEHLAQLIRPAGYFTLKARRLKSAANWFLAKCPQPDTHAPQGENGTYGTYRTYETNEKTTIKGATFGGNPPGEKSSRPAPPRRRFSETGASVDLRHLIGLEGAALESLRSELLDVWGIGPETADSILLYALECPTFVIDAYTMRLGERHGLFPAGAAYEEVKLIFEGLLGRDLDWFNDYHAQIVAVGKHYCHNRAPVCLACPLGRRDCFAGGCPTAPAFIQDEKSSASA